VRALHPHVPDHGRWRTRCDRARTWPGAGVDFTYPCPGWPPALQAVSNAYPMRLKIPWVCDHSLDKSHNTPGAPYFLKVYESGRRQRGLRRQRLPSPTSSPPELLSTDSPRRRRWSGSLLAGPGSARFTRTQIRSSNRAGTTRTGERRSRSGRHRRWTTTRRDGLYCH
jgi:hypothetical protein